MNEDRLTTKIEQMAQDMSMIRKEILKIINYIRDAESEIPERYRRFVNAFHDVHDIRYMYHEEGQTCPTYIDREIERLHDRYRQILEKMNAEGETFNKVRRDMASDPENRYDHTRLLDKPKEIEK